MSSKSQQDALRELDILALNQHINADATGTWQQNEMEKREHNFLTDPLVNIYGEDISQIPGLSSLTRGIGTAARAIDDFLPTTPADKYIPNIETIANLTPGVGDLRTGEYSALDAGGVFFDLFGAGLLTDSYKAGGKAYDFVRHPKTAPKQTLPKGWNEVAEEPGLATAWRDLNIPKGSELVRMAVDKGKSIIDKVGETLLGDRPSREFIKKAKNASFVDLGSKDAYNRYLKLRGWTESTSMLSYKQYRDAVKARLDLYNDDDILYMQKVLERGDTDVGGRYSEGLVTINPYHYQKSKLLKKKDTHSSAVHELDHKVKVEGPLQYSRMGGEAFTEKAAKEAGYKMPYLGEQSRVTFTGMGEVKINQRYIGHKWELQYWEEIAPYLTTNAKLAIKEIKKFDEIGWHLAPQWVKDYRYLLRPREISARAGQIREGNAPDYTFSQQRAILTEEGVKKATDELWGVVGIGAFDQMIDSSSDDADNLFED